MGCMVAITDESWSLVVNASELRLYPFVDQNVWDEHIYFSLKSSQFDPLSRSCRGDGAVFAKTFATSPNYSRAGDKQG